LRMRSRALQIGVGRLDRGKVAQAVGAPARELVEQVVERFLSPVADAGLAIERRKRLAAEYGAHPWDPEVMLGFDQVGDHLARAPGAFAVIVVEPGAGEAGELHPKDVGGALQDGQRLGEGEIRHVTPKSGLRGYTLDSIKRPL